MHMMYIHSCRNSYIYISYIYQGEVIIEDLTMSYMFHRDNNCSPNVAVLLISTRVFSFQIKL